MGETGCGKTRLIRYMCGLQAGPQNKDQPRTRNMLLVKVRWLLASGLFELFPCALNRMESVLEIINHKYQRKQQLVSATINLPPSLHNSLLD